MSWKRCAGWSLFVSLLAGIGVGIYRLQPHEPRWTASSIPSSSLVQFSADGNRITTTGNRTTIWANVFGGGERILVTDDSDGKPAACVWDVHTGSIIRRFPSSGDFSGASALSKNRLHVAYTFDGAVPKDDAARSALQLGNLETGEIRDIPIPPNEAPRSPSFSECDQYLMVQFNDDQHKSSRIRVYDAASGRLIADRPSLGYISDRSIVADFLLHLAPGNDGSQIEIWSLKEDKIVGTLDHTDGTAYVSPDGRFLLCERQAPEEKRGPWRVWNLRTRKPQAEFALDFTVSNVLFSPNGETAVMEGSPWNTRLELRRLSTGERLAHLNDPSLGVALEFSPDGQWLIAADRPIRHLRRWPAHTNGLRVLDAATLKELWNDGQNGASTCVCTPDSKRILQTYDAANEVRVLDLATGALLRTIELPNNQQARPPALTPDGRFMVVPRQLNNQVLLWAILVNVDPWWKKAIRWIGVDPERFSAANHDHAVVFDLEDDRECLRLVGWKVSDALISDDGSTLVTLHEEDGGRVMRCWDVHAWKPLWWAVGVPIAIGVGLVVLAKGWARWRKRKVAAPMTPKMS